MEAEEEKIVTQVEPEEEKIVTQVEPEEELKNPSENQEDKTQEDNNPTQEEESEEEESKKSSARDMEFYVCKNCGNPLGVIWFREFDFQRAISGPDPFLREKDVVLIMEKIRKAERPESDISGEGEDNNNNNPIEEDQIESENNPTNDDEEEEEEPEVIDASDDQNQ
ncbi:hypothetical protein M9H77_27839 [Catharanthus roseus]|uniref:Uncharacterized protein n=1 Tax=Catharanthus roseus TaxID=4058 RepID=A0ACC0AEP1_CATRO|nr:hypothetical protein M9H77_27839 [Catharanthus roseus]